LGKRRKTSQPGHSEDVGGRSVFFASVSGKVSGGATPTVTLIVFIASPQEELGRGGDERPSPATSLSERKMDLAAAAGGGHRDNKVKVMATQLLAKFEENAPPAQSTGLKRQVCGGSPRGSTSSSSSSSSSSSKTALLKSFPAQVSSLTQIGSSSPPPAFGGILQTRWTPAPGD